MTVELATLRRIKALSCLLPVKKWKCAICHFEEEKFCEEIQRKGLNIANVEERKREAKMEDRKIVGGKKKEKKKERGNDTEW